MNASRAGLRQLIRGLRRLAQSAASQCIRGSPMKEGTRACSKEPRNRTRWYSKERFKNRKCPGSRFGVRRRSLIGLESLALQFFVRFIHALSRTPNHDGKVFAKIAARPSTKPLSRLLLLGCGCIPLTICSPHRSNPRLS